MTGVPSRAARVVSENNDGLRSKTPLGTVGTATGAWEGTSKVEQAVSLDTWSPVKELANPSPRWLAAPFQPPNHATEGSRLQVFLLKAKGGLVWGASLYVLFS